MTLNWLLTFVVLLSCAVSIFQIARNGFCSLAQLGIPVLIGSAYALGYYLHPAWAGFYGGAVWLITVLLPNLLLRWTSSLLARRRYSWALKTSRLAGWLHPFDVAGKQSQLIQALDRFSQGKFADAMSLLEQLEQRPSALGRAATVLRIRHSGDWPSFLRTLEDQRQQKRFLGDSLGIDVYIQSLGETGQLPEMFAAFDEFVQHRIKPSTATFINLARLKVSAFAGQPELAELICAGPLSHLSEETKQFWIGTALQAGGQLAAAEQIFRGLTDSSDAQITMMAQQRLVRPVFEVGQLPTSARAVLMDFAETVDHESRYALFGQMRRQPTWMINTIALVLVFVFVIEMLHGNVFARVFMESNTLTIKDKIRLMLANAQDMETHIACGALVLPWSEYPGQWWRVFNAAFLHGGLIHLLGNLLGLLFLGRRLERVWGPIVTGFSYLTCAVLSIALMQFFVTVGPDQRFILVGASGGVMGLMGCLLSYMGVGMLVRRNAFVAGDFKWALFMAVAQFCIDQFTPNVSSACHLAGLLTGLCLGLLVGLFHQWLPRRKARKAQAGKQTTH